MKNISLLFLALSAFFLSTAQTSVLLLSDSVHARNAEISSYGPNLNANYGNYGVFASYVWGSTNYAEKALLQFDFTLLPQDAIIINASLNLYAQDPDNTFPGYTTRPMNGTNNASYLRRITQPWGTYTVTWNNQPRDTAWHQTTLPNSVDSGQNYLGTDVTQLIQDMLLYGNNGFMIEPVATTAYNSMVFRGSRCPNPALRPSLFITYTTAAITASIGSNKTLCNGSYMIFDPQISGGIAPFTYSWTSTGDALSCANCKNPSVTITQNSQFIFSITDANNTTVIDTVNYTVSTNTSLLQSSLSNTNIYCFHALDTTNAVVTNGTSPYTFNWGNGVNSVGSSPSQHTYSQPGIYVFSATDSFGCVTSAFDTVLDLGIAATVARTVQPNCVGDSTGKIVLGVTGGTPPYTYRWVTGVTTDSLVNIPGGNYSVTVTDANGCSALAYQTLNPIHDIWDFYAYLNSTNPNCINNGSVNAVVTGGVSPYTYRWSTGDTTTNISNLAAGTYVLSVYDQGGCLRKADATLAFNCASVISGYVFIDSNNNCIIDSNEYIITGAGVTASAGGNYYYGYTDYITGQYTIIVPDTGTYNLQEYGSDGYCANFILCGNPSQNVTISVLGDSSVNNNFAEAFSSGFDLTMHPGWTSADPGFEKEYWIMPYNQSSLPFTGLYTVTFAYDSNLVYEYSLPPLPVVDTVNHTLTWTADTTLPFPFYDWYGYRFENFFHVPVTLNLGYNLQSDFWITPTTGDCDSSNNHLHFSETVIGSHDPNEKTVYPANTISPDDSILQYTIHFQNTGTDSTWFIVIKDTLAPELDPSSVKNLASSHPYSAFGISGKGILTWTFNPLRLVDSVANVRGSQGFVSFSVKKRKNLPLETIISNKAYVYFDYYAPVITNTVSDTISLGVATTVNQIKAISGVSVKAFPNPFSTVTHINVEGLNTKFDFELYDYTGRLTKRISEIDKNEFDVNGTSLAAGMYFYRISVGSNHVATGKLAIQ